MQDGKFDRQEVASSARAKSIVRGIGSLSVQSILNVVLGFVLLTTLLRFLPSLDYGAYSSLAITVGIANAIAVFGLNYAPARFLAAQAEKNADAGWNAARASFSLAIGQSAVAAIVIAIGAPFLSLYFMKDVSWSWVYLLGAFWVFTSSLSLVAQAIIQGTRQYSKLATVLLASKIASVGIAVAGVVLFKSLAVVIASWAVYGLLVLVFCLPHIWPHLLRAKPSYVEVLRYATPLGVVALVSVVSSNVDILIVGGYLNPTSLGIYNAAITIASVLTAFFVAPLATAFFAETSASSRNPEEVATGVALATRFAFTAVLPASFYASAMSTQLLDLISGGGVYFEGVLALQLVTLFYVLSVVSLLLGYVLLSEGRTESVLVINLVTAAGGITIALSLIPRLGLFGAAISRIGVMALGAYVSFFLTRQRLNITKDARFYLKAIFSSALPACTIFALSAFVSNQTITLLPYSLIAVTIFLCCVKALKLLDSRDRELIRQALPPRFKWFIKLL